MKNEKPTSDRPADGCATAVLACTLCYVAIQTLGLLVGALVIVMTEFGSSTVNPVDADLEMIPLLMVFGLFFTFIPTAVYSPILTVLVAWCIRRHKPIWVSYVAAVILTVPFFLVGYGLPVVLVLPAILFSHLGQDLPVIIICPARVIEIVTDVAVTA